MATYNLGDLVGKNLFATGKVPVYRFIFNKTPLYYTVPGQSIGTLYSWVTDKATGAIWLQFLDSNKKTYYVSVASLKGKLSLTELKYEGAKTTEEKYEEAKAAAEKDNDPIEYYIKKYGTIALFVIGGLILIKKTQ